MASVTHNEPQHRFELQLAEGLALLEYELSGRDLVLFHTEVPPSRQGQGIGTQLIEAALLHAKTRNLRVNPVCPFVLSYLREHPEYDEITKSESA
jgi:predicted GNAT family acetyltransferase